MIAKPPILPAFAVIVPDKVALDAVIFPFIKVKLELEISKSSLSHRILFPFGFPTLKYPVPFRNIPLPIVKLVAFPIKIAELVSSADDVIRIIPLDDICESVIRHPPIVPAFAVIVPDKVALDAVMFPFIKVKFELDISKSLLSHRILFPFGFPTLKYPCPPKYTPLPVFNSRALPIRIFAVPDPPVKYVVEDDGITGVTKYESPTGPGVFAWSPRANPVLLAVISLKELL